MGLKDTNWARLNIPMLSIAPQTVASNATVVGKPWTINGKKGNILVALLTLGNLAANAAGRIKVEMTADSDLTGATWVDLPSNSRNKIGADGYRTDTNLQIGVQAVFVQGDDKDENTTAYSVDMDYVPEEAKHLRFTLINTTNVTFPASVSMVETGLYNLRTDDMETIDGFHNLLRYGQQL